jgi:hypothetical protein
LFDGERWGWAMAESPNSFIKWLEANSHWSHWVGLVVAALGLLAGFWLSEKPEGEITLKFTTVKIAEANLPGIKILDNSNNQITGNIFGTEVVLWNTGDLTLGEKSDRIRKPITITFSGVSRIIDSVVQDTKNVDPTTISIEKSQNDVTIKWTQFDPGDAIKVFVIYTGQQQAAFEYEGRFVSTRLADISEFKEEYPSEHGLTAIWDFIKYDFKFRFWRTVGLLVGLIGQVFAVILMFYSLRRPGLSKLVFALWGVAAISLVLSMIGELFVRSSPF